MKIQTAAREKLVLVVLVLVALVSLFRLGAVSLFDVDEAIFAEATKEMVMNNDWLTPTYNGANRYDKPVLFYWLMGLSYKVFGINEFGARFPSALAGIILSLCLFYFVRRVWDAGRALYAVMSFVCSIYFVVYSHAAVTDMTLSLFITLSLFSFYLHVAEAGRGRFYLRGFYLFSALAFLTKGLVGIVFPFGIAAAYMVANQGASSALRLFSVSGALLFIVVSAPWYAAQLYVNGREFVDQFFIKHHFRRYTDVISGHKGPFYFYIPALLVGLMPWIIFLPRGLADAVKKLKRPELPASGPEDPVVREHSAELFALIWFSAIVVFFSLSTTKLPNYILPAIPACSILIACGMSGQSERAARYSHGMMAFISLTLCAGLIVSRRFLAQYGITDTGWILVLSFIMFGGAGLNAYAAVKGRRFFEYAGIITLVSLLILTYKALPIAGEKLQGSLLEYSLYAKNHLPIDEKIVAYRIIFPSIVFYSGRNVVQVNDDASLKALVSADGGRLAIARSSDKGALEGAGFIMIKSGERYSLFERRNQ
ncbi:MAG: glycosyltransferase family 39 protein [Nitrospirae bacterium]|nr:glycosyltransferase family 39 protein [Nitrospirota bacterium]